MNHEKLTGKSIFGIAVVLLLAGQASAKEQAWSEIDAEIQSCVAEVAAHANYDDATRVRHAVIDVKERALGYKLNIETSLYDETGEAAIREYATSCIVNGDYAPLQFSIRETRDDT